MTESPIIIEREFDVQIDKLWEVISQASHLKKWFIEVPEFKAEVGFKFQFVSGPREECQYLHLCEVTEVIPNRKLTYSWLYDGYKGISYVTFELSEKGSKTLLKLTHKGVESFPQDNPDFRKEDFGTGWTQIIGTSLPEYLSKKDN